jgi:predicted nucleic acid-binding protein
MNGKEFVDTNILICAFDLAAGSKRTTAIELLERLWTDRTGCLSVQVLQEFYVNATRKLTMPAKDAAAQVQRLAKWSVFRPDTEDVLQAIHLHCDRKVSFWDAMILRSAMASGCFLLWSEDLSSEQRWGELIVRNPFAGMAG